VSSNFPQYRIFEANAATTHIAEVEQSHKRGIDLRAALDFLLSRDPLRGARKIDGISRDLYIVCTTDFYDVCGVRMCILYEIKEQNKEIEIVAAAILSGS